MMIANRQTTLVNQVIAEDDEVGKGVVELPNKINNNMPNNNGKGTYTQAENGLSVKPKLRRRSTVGELLRRPSLANFGKRLSQASFFSQNSRYSLTGGTDRSNTKIVIGNSYKMGPESDDVFNSARAGEMVTSLLQKHLEHSAYDPNTCGRLSTYLTDLIKNKIKDIANKRYKIVVNVIIGENTGQSCQMVSRCLWNTDSDRFASTSYANSTLFAVANVYAIYYE